MPDLSSHKIDVFSDINDIPVPPTPNRAGNGSHLISKINTLIDELNSELQRLQEVIDNSGGSGGGAIPGLTYDGMEDAISISKYVRFSNKIVGNKVSFDGSQRQRINISMTSGQPNVGVTYENISDYSNYTLGSLSGAGIFLQKMSGLGREAEVKLGLVESGSSFTPALLMNDVQVVGKQQPAISSPSADVAELSVTVNSIIDCLRAHGLIAATGD